MLRAGLVTVWAAAGAGAETNASGTDRAASESSLVAIRAFMVLPFAGAVVAG